MGTLSGDPLVKNRLDQETGFTYFKRVGWDANEHFGWELRFSETWLPLSDSSGRLTTRMDHVLLGDVNLLVYPWGDRRIRPFVSLGTGVADFNFEDQNQIRHVPLWGLPIGIGLKYLWNDSFALRADFMDNVAFGRSEVATMHNTSFVLGGELRIGNLRRHLNPWYRGGSDH